VMGIWILSQKRSFFQEVPANRSSIHARKILNMGKL
jgi:hypothetical protein